MQKGPWFIGSRYLSIRHREPKFNPSQAHTPFSTIWIRLPQLPTEYCDLQTLQKIGNFFGQLLKIDAYTMQTTRGHYTRLCILEPLDKTLPIGILIVTHLQPIHYEEMTPLCKLCDCLGHILHSCPSKLSIGPSNNAKAQPHEPIVTNDDKSLWHTVTFPKQY